MNDIDRRILEFLQANARMSNADIARDLDMAPSAVLERIRKLEQRGLIVGYEAKIAPKSIGLGLTAFLFVQSDETTGPSKTAKALGAIPEVLEVHNVAGEDCFLIKVRVKDTDDLALLLRDKIRRIPKIKSTRTTIVLETSKETSALPLHHLIETDEK
jgi:Lrp/AsnC family transcriptional regulator, leucine-responsive regulatory protein